MSRLLKEIRLLVFDCLIGRGSTVQLVSQLIETLVTSRRSPTDLFTDLWCDA